MIGLTATQIKYYFMPRHLKFFNPDITVDYGNNYISYIYTIDCIRETMKKFNIPIRNTEQLNSLRSYKPLRNKVIKLLTE